MSSQILLRGILPVDIDILHWLSHTTARGYYATVLVIPSGSSARAIYV